MKLTMDRAGRVVVPKPLRDALGMPDGGDIDISIYGAGLQLVPSGSTARLVETNGHLVAVSETVVDDDMVFALIDSGRR
ncbi:AbrB/MazE/SpoVT family DNA-binding domain-containing protein [Salinibacterium sp.]|uniref:AbrB/MazE/SpoVT family DNA-binding domain-containing protein n=1 Tax=Salinibacterium sp. TaxID=1915057 RepID=UPI00286AD7E8|nr:AbrB/MazE/SpoVT family DNA-binding domain-containing protein [Salinibacterium sp.]